MGKKQRIFKKKLASVSNVFLVVVNIVFIAFGIYTAVDLSTIDPNTSVFYTETLSLNNLMSAVFFCGVTVVVVTLFGLIALAWNIRPLLLMYFIGMLSLGLSQLVIGGIMDNKACDELRPAWFSTTRYWNDARQDFKLEGKCCGFADPVDDYALDADDPNVNKIRTALGFPTTRGCFIDLNDVNVPATPCRDVCDLYLENEVQPISKGCIALGVLELVATGIVMAMTMMNKKRQAWIETSPFHY